MTVLTDCDIMKVRMGGGGGGSNSSDGFSGSGFSGGGGGGGGGGEGRVDGYSELIKVRKRVVVVVE